MMKHLFFRFFWLLSLMIFLNACTWSPENGSTFSGDSNTQTINVSGAYTEPNVDIEVQAYDMGSSSWVTLVTTQSSATDTGDSVRGALYTWSTSVSPGVSGFWEQDGIVQIRAIAIDGGQVRYPITFDDFSCVLEELGADTDATYGAAAVACKSYNTPVLTFVDTDSLPDKNTVSYLNTRTTPSSGTFDYDCGDGNCEQLDYYNEINAPANFFIWQLQAGFIAIPPFSSTAVNAASAKYYNAFDLGLGRDMNCRQLSNGRVSCYVTNYGTPVTDDHVAALDDLLNGVDKVATVAMTYYPNRTSNDVTFYVYDDQDQLITDIPLDEQGAKAVPGVCLNCHGGSYNPSNDAVTDARFLPFDIENYKFSSVSGFSLNAQEESFRKLNQIVLATDVPTGAIVISGV